MARFIDSEPPAIRPLDCRKVPRKELDEAITHALTHKQLLGVKKRTSEQGEALRTAAKFFEENPEHRLILTTAMRIPNSISSKERERWLREKFCQ